MDRREIGRQAVRQNHHFADDKARWRIRVDGFHLDILAMYLDFQFWTAKGNRTLRGPSIVELSGKTVQGCEVRIPRLECAIRLVVRPSFRNLDRGQSNAISQTITG